MLIQWLRALHARLQMRESRRLVQELLADPALFPAPVLWNPPMDAEYPPFFSLYLSCTDALEAGARASRRPTCAPRSRRGRSTPSRASRRRTRTPPGST